ncbi:MAG: YraN family protein [Oscillochloris sp.]|nr:YraN family protein [Oscillochloris sp.]
MPSPRRALGDFGEAAARTRLLHAGYRILASNWRCRHGEIDLVAQQGDQIVFVEVRTRRQAGPVPPEESLSPTKRARLLTLAAAYLAEAGLPSNTSCRIDLMAVEIDRTGRISRLDQIINAVEES